MSTLFSKIVKNIERLIDIENVEWIILICVMNIIS